MGRESSETTKEKKYLASCAQLCCQQTVLTELQAERNGSFEVWVTQGGLAHCLFSSSFPPPHRNVSFSMCTLGTFYPHDHRASCTLVRPRSNAPDSTTAGHWTLKDSTNWPSPLHHLQGTGYVLFPQVKAHKAALYTLCSANELQLWKYFLVPRLRHNFHIQIAHASLVSHF